MERKLREFFNKLLENRMRRAVALVLAIIVTFTTAYTLVLPAITLEKETAETMSGVNMGGNEQDGDASASNGGEGSDDSGLDDGNIDTIAFDAEAKNEAGETETLVHVETAIDAFPEGTTMEATVVTDQDVIDSITDAAEGEVVAVRAVDLTFTDENGETVQASEGSQLNVTLSPGEGVSSSAQNEENASDSLNQTEESKGEEVFANHSTETTVVQYTEDKGAETVEANDDVTFQVDPETDLDQDNAVSFDTGEQTGNQESQTFAIVETVPENVVKESGFTEVEEKGNSGVSGDVSTAENELAAETEENPLEENPDVNMAEVPVEEQVELVEEPVIEYQEGVLTAQDESSYIITMTYGPEALIPEDAYLQVEEILETETYDTHLEETQKALNEAAQAGQKPEEGIYAGPAIEEELQFFSLQSLTVDSEEPEHAPAPEPEIVYARFFDITILKPNGEEVTPAAQVKVAIELLDAKQDEEVIQSAESAQVIHFGKDEPELMEAETIEDAVASVVFDTDSFSVYGVVYTVDFTYESRTWSFPGQGSYRLADVLAVLGIEGSIDEAALTLIMGEDHTGALYLTQAGGEYYINSDIAFSDTYELRVRSGETIYIITVTDTQISTDLSDFISNAVITGATQDPDGSYHVERGEEYSIILTFAESSNYQFDNTGTLTYQIPEGIEILTKQEGDGNINIVYKGRTYQVGFHYVLDTDRSLEINFDTTDPDFPRLEESTNVSFRFTYTGEFDGSKTTIEFNDVIERDITFDEPEPGQAYVSKNGTFNETTGTYHYTVKVTASGAVTDVNVRDVISGNALIFNNDVQVSGNSGSYTDNHAVNGFDYTFASMQEGEEITINYSAKIDPSKIPANGILTADMTRNTVTVTPDDGPPHNSSYSHEINLKKPDKSTGVESGTTADGKKLYKWTIDYNTLALAKAGGDTVSDSIGESSRQYMKYHGNVVVKVYDHSGNLVNTRSFTPSTDYTWTYIVPDADTTPYRYVFEYETEVNQAAIDLTGSSVKLNNDSEGPGGKDSEGITVVPKESTSITKEVVSSDEQEITWISHIHVPESGLSRAVVTDTLPYIWSGNLGLSGNYMLYDEYKEGTLEIIGLEGESYNVAHYIDPNDSHDKIVITFYKDIDKTTEGLKGGTPGGRDITVKLTTKVNQDWLNAGYNYPTSYQSFHTNNININGGEDVQAQVKYIEPSIEKSGSSSGKGVYKYTIYVTHVDSSPIVVNDKFDTSLLEVDTSLDGHDWNYQSMYITGGDYPGHVYSGDTSVKVDYSDTTDGIQITANNVPLQSNGQFYPTYMITYFLKLKEGVDLEQLAIANGGKHDLTNTAMWNGHEDSFTFTTKYDFLNKKLLNEGALGGTDRKAQYQITFNPAGATLNNGEPMVMTDVMSANLSVDYSSIRIVTDPEGQEVPYSLSGGKDEHGVSNGTTVATYTVPDSTRVVITYDADVRGNGSQTIVNTVSVNDEDETITTTKSYGTVTEGEGAIASFKIVKVDGYDANKKLKGVKFRIFAENPNIEFADGVKELVLETDENGEIVIDGEKYQIMFNEVYHVQEVEPLEDYGTIGFDYLVTLTNKMAEVNYDHYVYYYSDSMQIKNWPLEGLVVEKQVDSPNDRDKEQYYQFRISILKDDGTVNTSYNEKNGDDQFVNGVFNFELKDKEQKMFWGFQKGTRYKVEEIDSKGLSVSVTYSVFDEEGNVTEIKTDTDQHTGTLTQEDEVIVFTNAKTEEKGVDLDIIKIRQGSNPVQYLDGATFSLRQIADTAATEGGTYQDAENAIKKTGTTADGGKLTFSGLVHGYYELTETIAPTGYVLTGDMTVYFKVDDNGVTWLTKGSGAPSTWVACTSTSSSLVTFKNASEATADDPETPEDGSVAATNAAFTIRNTPGSALPQTGGPGTTALYLFGFTLTGLAGTGLVTRKKQRETA